MILAAAITCAPREDRPEQSCRVCATNPEQRELWGCDGPAEEPWGHTECPFCDENPECESCGGTGQMPLRDCPHRVVTDRELGVVRAVAMVEQGVLPDAGGWNDQAATFVAAYPFCAREIAGWRERDMDRRQEKARQQAEQRGRRR